MKFGVIYKITNLVNGKIYIGQTIRNLQTRINSHFNINSLRKNMLTKAISKYGKDKFIVEVICSCSNIEDLNYCEEYLIANHKSNNRKHGYNILPGGKNRTFPQALKAQISQTKRGIPNLKLKGKPKSTEHKEKLRQIKLGKKQTLEHAKNAARARTGEAHWLYGKSHSEETKSKVSKTKKGIPLRTDLIDSYTTRINAAAEKTKVKIYSPSLDLNFNSITDASKLLNIPVSNISAVCRGKRKSSHGETFMFAAENNNG